MTFNLVQVTGRWYDNQGNFAEGNYMFDADGTLVTDPSTAIVTSVIRGQLDTTGSLWDGVTDESGVSLLASDNFAPGQLLWHILLRIQGFFLVDLANVVINYSDGPSQGIFDILNRNGWTPPNLTSS